MAVIIPSITTDDDSEFLKKVDIYSQFSSRIHIDISDGIFSPSVLKHPDYYTKTEKLLYDYHLMVVHPSKIVDRLIDFGANLIIVHVECSDNLLELINYIKLSGVKVGVCLLDTSQPEDYSHIIAQVDHVLIFGGRLGFYGGQAQLQHLSKIHTVKQINSQAEIGWDGGANDQNINYLIDSGVDAITVGGYIGKSDIPRLKYLHLLDITKQL